ncbi:MAG: hypothetical protein K0S74_96 [Chlamydiales bacterium]|jgi:GlpG protein|nr:hypothetical protein [Chlamydiales bacterium]
MRRVAQFTDQKDAIHFSLFLISKSIKNHTEQAASEEKTQYILWVDDEEKVLEAQNYYKEFIKDPQNLQWQHQSTENSKLSDSIQLSLLQDQKSSLEVEKSVSPIQVGKLSFLITFICILCFVYGAQHKPNILSPVERLMLYDYPHALELHDQYVTLESPKMTVSEEQSSEVQSYFREQYEQTAWWKGVYFYVMETLRSPSVSLQIFSTKLDLSIAFEKIRAGEWWRIITPIFLHANLIHLALNLVWFVTLGSQIEERLLLFRYLSLIVVIAIVSNTCQYLMTGWHFVGISGVITGLLGFIWARQKIAPWEGYSLLPSTARMLLIFLLLTFLFEVYAVIAAWLDLPIFQSIIANTAHVTGALIGLMLGRLPFFNWVYLCKNKKQ